MRQDRSENPEVDPTQTLYAMLDDWCGETFDPIVARRLSGLPQDQASSLLIRHQEWANAYEPRILRAGECFAYVPTFGTLDVCLFPSSHRWGTEEKRLSQVLLYAHGVALEEPLGRHLESAALGRDRGDLDLALIRLARYRALADVNALSWVVRPAHSSIIYEEATSASYNQEAHRLREQREHELDSLMDLEVDWWGIEHPPILMVILDRVREAVTSDNALSLPNINDDDHERQRKLGALTELINDVVAAAAEPHNRGAAPKRAWLDMALLEIEDQLGWASSGSTSLHFRLPIIAQAFTKLANGAAALPVAARSDSIVTDLGRLLVPGQLDLSLSDVVALRRNSDAFYTWRSSLRTALADLDSLPNADDWRTVAKAQTLEILAPASTALNTEVKRSSAMARARQGAGTFSISGVGAASAGLLSGGAVAPALVSGATAGIVGSVAQYLRGRAQSRHGRALLAHYTAVVDALP